VSEEAKLFLLKDKLNEVRRNKWATRIVAFFGVIIFFVLLEMEGFLDYFTATIFMVLVGVSIMLFIDYHYRNEEAQIIQQMEQMAIKTES